MGKLNKRMESLENRKFPSGTALMVLLSMARHKCAGVSTLKKEIKTASNVELSHPGIHAALKNLLEKDFAKKMSLKREGALNRGEHGSMFCYELTEPGREHLEWMLKSLQALQTEKL